uniref:Uncharacterized protein n=1 Tax=Panagrolaimus sp. PS1159 TaxID=55785 RepID=A0AC35F1E8_9BILA
MTSILLSNEYFNKLDQSYQKCIMELEKELNETLWYDSALKSEIIDKFSDKYLMPKEIWDKRIDLQSLDANPNPKAEYKNIKEKALTHFYSKRKHPIYYRDPNRKLLKAKFLPAIFPLYEELQITFGEIEENDNDKFDQKYIEYCLTFPHWRLEECLKEFDEISVTPIPKRVFKKYKNVKELYDKIKLSENDLNQWFKCLLESEDDVFIIHNIEYCIGTDLTNKDLWKLYIQYLRDSKKYYV